MMGNFKIGDSVTVKTGVKDDDFDLDLSGWQGRIIEVTDDETVGIAWDSVTLRKLPSSYIEASEEEGMGWDEYYLGINDVERASARDKPKDVERAREELAAGHSWDHLGEEGRRIQKVLAGVQPGDDWGAFEAWQKHLTKILSFPFEAEISESQRGPLRMGDRLSVKDIDDVEDLYGILAAVKHERGRYQIPLCDLEVTDKKSANYLPVSDYSVWFANR
jgi:hypothetical protein